MATLMEKLKEFTREREQSPENVEQDDEDYVYPGDDEEDEPDSVDDKNFEYEFDNDEQSEEEPTEDDDYSYPGDDEGESDELDQDNSDETDKEEEDVVDVATENPSMQGLIRNVAGATLVSKRKQSDDTYTELWMYTVRDVKNGIGVRNEILSGTDIPLHRISSDDEIQSYTSWSTGNIEMIEIKGLEQ